MSHDDIRQRLAAIEHIDWSKVRREESREYYGDFVSVGPVLMLGADKYDPPNERAQEGAILGFLQNAAADIRRLLAELDADQTTREAIMPSNQIYGPPPDPDRGEAVRYLADVVEVNRPDGSVMRMDLIALADAIIKADRAVIGLREEVAELRGRLTAMTEKVRRIERAGRILAEGYDA